MSLLTDKKILAALNEAWGNDGEDTINDVECGDRAIADASQAVTLKAVAKEMDSRCPHFQKRRPKSDCPGCMVGLMTACLGGKLSGEE